MKDLQIDQITENIKTLNRKIHSINYRKIECRKHDFEKELRPEQSDFIEVVNSKETKLAVSRLAVQYKNGGLDEDAIFKSNLITNIEYTIKWNKQNELTIGDAGFYAGMAIAAPFILAHFAILAPFAGLMAAGNLAIGLTYDGRERGELTEGEILDKEYNQYLAAEEMLRSRRAEEERQRKAKEERAKMLAERPTLVRGEQQDTDVDLRGMVLIFTFAFTMLIFILSQQ